MKRRAQPIGVAIGLAIIAPANAWAEGPYVAAEGGMLDLPSLRFKYAGLSHYFVTKYAPGVDADIQAGYDFGGLRVDLETSYKRARADQFGFDILGQPQGVRNGSDVSGRVQAVSEIMNVNFDIGQGPWKGYAGAGVGVTDVIASKLGYSRVGSSGIFLDHSDASIVFQTWVGVRRQITNHLAMKLSYRFFDAEHIRIHVATSTASTKWHSSSLLAGLVFSFRGPPPPPEPLPPLPPPLPPPPPPVATSFTVYFDPGVAAIDTVAGSILDLTAVAFMREHHAALMIMGRGDWSAPAPYSEALAQNRADVLRRGLVARGVPSDEIAIERFDSSDPFAPDKTSNSDVGSVDITFGPGSGQ